MRCQARLQRLQPPASPADPVRQGRAVDLNAMTREDLSLAIERRVVAIFAHQHMRQEAGTRHSLSDRSFGRRCLVDRTAATAAIFGTANAQHAKPCWDEVEHLADGLADRMEGAAAAGTNSFFNIDRHILARQMVGQ